MRENGHQLDVAAVSFFVLSPQFVPFHEVFYHKLNLAAIQAQEFSFFKITVRSSLKSLIPCVNALHGRRYHHGQVWRFLLDFTAKLYSVAVREDYVQEHRVVFVQIRSTHGSRSGRLICEKLAPQHHTDFAPDYYFVVCYEDRDSFLHLRLRQERQSQGKTSPLAAGAFYFYSAIMGYGYSPGQIQTSTGSVGSETQLEYLAQVFRRDSRAGIFHAYKSFEALVTQGNLYPAAFLAELNGIADNVVQRSHQKSLLP
jgi:hypothetical protein